MSSRELSSYRNGCLDSSKTRSDVNEYVQEGDKLIGVLGKKFETDKATIELMMTR